MARRPNDASAEVEQDGRRHNRHDLMRLDADAEPFVAVGEPSHHAVGCGEPIGTPAREGDGLH
jgi:hypothetical protein